MPRDRCRCTTPTPLRALEARATRALGGDAFELMRRAGQAAWRELLQHWPQAQRIVVVCGPGNNGGDGYVLARHARDSPAATCASCGWPAMRRAANWRGAPRTTIVAVGGAVESFARRAAAGRRGRRCVVRHRPVARAGCARRGADRCDQCAGRAGVRARCAQRRRCRPRLRARARPCAPRARCSSSRARPACTPALRSIMSATLSLATLDVPPRCVRRHARAARDC